MLSCTFFSLATSTPNASSTSKMNSAKASESTPCASSGVPRSISEGCLPRLGAASSVNFWATDSTV